MSNLISYREKINRINLTRELKKKQKKVNEMYEEKGLTDEVLDLQLEINQTRHKENIPDSKKTIYKNFVQ